MPVFIKSADYKIPDMFYLTKQRLLPTRDALRTLPEGKLLINTINAHSYNVAQKDELFAAALQGGDVLIADGWSIVKAGRWLRMENRPKERCAGWDLFVYEMQRLNENSERKNENGRVMFMGSSPKVLRLIVEHAAKQYPHLEVITYSPPYKKEFSDEDNAAIVKAINTAQPDLLWIGMTAPKQEKWTWQHWNELDIHCHVGTIGAVFDFFAGTSQRAPQWWQDHSLEWFYRLIKEPRRMWRRYMIGNPLFLCNIYKEKKAVSNEAQTSSTKPHSSSSQPTVDILNIQVNDVTQEELLREYTEGVLVTPNLDHLVKLQHDRAFYDAYQEARWVVCDSRVLFFVSRLTRRPIREAIAGSSFFPAYCDYHRNDADCRIFLLGGMDDTAQRARERINQRIGRNIVVDALSPSWGFDQKEDECRAIAERINQSGANVVVVGVGAPKQEKWIMKWRETMPGIKAWMALGATIDFEAGTSKRAPQFCRTLGMEWFYRFLCEPRRLFHRYFIRDMRFFGYYARQLTGHYKNPF